MKEAAFVKQNKLRWEEFEKVVQHNQQASPDIMLKAVLQNI